MEINIVSGKFQFDGDESSDIEFNVSKLIVQMELSEMSKLGRIPESFNCSFVFSWTDPHPTNNRPIITRVDHKCSETILSKELESAVNDRLLKIKNSDEMTFYHENTDEVLFNKIKDLHQTIELREEAARNKILKEEFYRSEPEGTWLVENPSRSNKLLYLLMAAGNTKIHAKTLQRAQNHLDMA